jgi:hypothetical protein
MDIMYITVKTASVLLCGSERSQCCGLDTLGECALQAVLVSCCFALTQRDFSDKIFDQYWPGLGLTISSAAGRIFNRHSLGYFN